MIRRNFIKSLLLAPFGLAVPAAAATIGGPEVPEKDYQIDGYNVTEFVWPQDRLIEFYDDVSGEYWMVPTFDVRRVTGTCRENLLKSAEFRDGSSWVHYIRICGYPTLVGIASFERKCRPSWIAQPDRYAAQLELDESRIRKLGQRQDTSVWYSA
jgi:hypothetical protein